MKSYRQFKAKSIEDQAWGRAGFSIVEIGDPSVEPKFRSSDYAIVRRGLKELPEAEREVVFLRFWSGFDLNKIAELLNLTVTTVERVLDDAFIKLKSACLSDRDFSRAIPCGKIVASLAA